MIIMGKSAEFFKKGGGKVGRFNLYSFEKPGPVIGQFSTLSFLLLLSLYLGLCNG